MALTQRPLSQLPPAELQEIQIFYETTMKQLKDSLETIDEIRTQTTVDSEDLMDRISELEVWLDMRTLDYTSLFLTYGMHPNPTFKSYVLNLVSMFFKQKEITTTYLRDIMLPFKIAPMLQSIRADIEKYVRNELEPVKEALKQKSKTRTYLQSQNPRTGRLSPKIAKKFGTRRRRRNGL